MSKFWQAASILAIPALVAVGYGIYLVGGGHWGREYIKSVVARARMETTYTIRAGDGGDCARIGSWDRETGTCALNADLDTGATIFVKDDDITLEGNNRRLTGRGDRKAVVIVGNSGIVVRGLVIEGYDEGVYLQYATRNTITNLAISRTAGHAIHLTGNSNLNAIINNDVGPSTMHGIALWSSDGNFIANNRVRETRDAIRLQSSRGNVMVLNEVRESQIEGFDLHLSSANRVVLNNVLETRAIPVLDDVGKNANLYWLGSGGNFYAQFDSAKGCTDGNGDGICDAAYRFAVGTDLKPLSRPLVSISGAR